MAIWSYQNPVQISFGCGSRREVSSCLSGSGRVLVVTTPGSMRRSGVMEIIDALRDRDPIVIDDVEPNPTLANLEAHIRALAGVAISDVVAIGGGSALDSAKVIAVGVSQPDFDLREHLLNGAGLPERRSNRLICLPTTAGTGSEVTPFATVWGDVDRKKYSVAGLQVFADSAILDPELTLSVPREITIMTGLDAVTQAFEATWSRRANTISTAHAIQAIRLGVEALPRLQDDPGDLALREEMLQASLLAGLAISSARTALCHSISYPLTMHLGVPHGLACGFVLPEVLAFNRCVEMEWFERLALAQGHESGEVLEQSVQAWMEMLGVGSLLRAQGFSRAGVLDLAPEMLTPGRADNNLRDASVADVTKILTAAMDGRGL